jgi:regulatory subunit for Cdc7p protein kinase
MEMAPPYIHEYMLPKSRKDADVKKPWPVLYCHPHSRGPFIPFDDKERRRWEKAQTTLRKEEVERREAEEKKAQIDLVKRRAAMIPSSHRNGGDLRRTVSMNNLHKQQDIDADADESACASGFLASGQSAYVAASGNSVNITSTTGTTSTAGYSFGHELPQSLRTRMSREIVTSRKPSVIWRQGEDKENEAPEIMGPPSIIPEKRASTLRRSASTNSVRLPKRDETTKPGYCESCRQRFDDFKLVSLPGC